MSKYRLKQNAVYVMIVVMVLVFFYSTRVGTRPEAGLPLNRNLESKEAAIFTARGDISYSEAERKIFRPLGLHILETSLIPKLQYIEQPTCEKNIPNNWEMNYTLNGYTHLKTGYMDDRSGVKSSRWDMVEDWIKKDLVFFSQRGENYYSGGIAMFTAMRHYPLDNKEGIVIGSLTPWVESFALRNGAKQVTTLEYMKIEVVGTDKVIYKHPVEMAKQAKKSIFLESPLNRIVFIGICTGYTEEFGWQSCSQLIDSFLDASPSPVTLDSTMFGKDANLCSGLTQRVFVLRKNNH